MEDSLKTLITAEEISGLVKKIAGSIDADFKERPPVLIGVLKGAFVFLSDLARALPEGRVEIDFIQTSSYGKRDEPSKTVEVVRDVTTDLAGRDVIVVEGIIDRGTTARTLLGHFRKKGPSSISLCALLLRNGHAGDLEIRYYGRRIDEGFVVGYGMDFKEKYRGLPAIYTMEPPVK